MEDWEVPGRSGLGVDSDHQGKHHRAKHALYDPFSYAAQDLQKP
jgi:hypothetical protein